MLLQPPSEIQEIDSKFFQENRPAKKEEKNFGKTKSINVSNSKH